MSRKMTAELIKIRDNMQCPHCHAIFIATDSQAFHFKYSNRVAYCSNVCRSAASSEKRTIVRPIHGPCPTCDNMFESLKPKIYCSMKCYQNSPQMIEQIKLNSVKGNLAHSINSAEKAKRVCPVCKKEFRAKIKTRKYCSSLCYRKFKADLYDAWIANPQNIALPQNYDEFMLQDELPCLVEGCTWEGRHLSVHLNQAHGILAADFKRAVGFNMKTGLVNPSLSAKLIEQNAGKGLDGEGMLLLRDKSLVKRKDIIKYDSLEGKEHKIKAICELAILTGPQRKCLGCCKLFTQKHYLGKAIYCSVECRTKYYRTNKVIETECLVCGIKYNAPAYEKNTSTVKVCSIHCRQKRAGKIARKTWPGDSEWVKLRTNE